MFLTRNYLAARNEWLKSIKKTKETYNKLLILV